MKNIVEINGVEVYAYHGCMDEEARLGGKFVVDAAVETNFTRSAETDELIDTIDYVVMREIIIEEMSVRSKLLEHVGYRILNRFKKEFPTMISAKIRVSKLNAPLGGIVKDVAIVIEG